MCADQGDANLQSSVGGEYSKEWEIAWEQIVRRHHKKRKPKERIKGGWSGKIFLMSSRDLHYSSFYAEFFCVFFYWYLYSFIIKSYFVIHKYTISSKNPSPLT